MLPRFPLSKNSAYGYQRIEDML